MNKISIYALTFFLSLSSVTVYSQKNNKQVILLTNKGAIYFIIPSNADKPYTP